MILKLRLLHGAGAIDVEVDAPPAATVADLVARLAHRNSVGEQSDVFGPTTVTGLVLNPASSASRVLAPDVLISDSGIQSGSTIGPTAARLSTATPIGATTLTVVEGPDAPATFVVPTGTSTIGRQRDRTVRLSDPMVSKRHARIRVGESIELIDDASSNGLLVGNRVADRVVLRSGDRVTLGETCISIDVLPDAESVVSSVKLNRSPRVDPVYVGIELAAPEPPQPPTRNRFPVISLIAPIMMAGVIYAVTKSTLSILFVALSPLMMIGGWLEHRSSNRRQYEQALAHFRSGLDDLAVQLEYARQLEQTGRRQEHPSVVDCLESAHSRSQLLWTRRPEHRSFSEVRLGLGTRPSRNSVAMPAANRTVPELWRDLNDVVARFVSVEAVPVVGDVRSCGNVGVCGPEVAAAPVLRGLLIQYAALHAPNEFVIAGIGGDPSWDWMKWLPHVDHAAIDGPLLASNGADAAALVSAIEQLIERRSDLDSALEDRPLPMMLVFVHDRAPVDRARLVLIAERGPDVSIFVVWYAAGVERLPAACRTFVELGPDRQNDRVGFVVTGETIDDLAVEAVGSDAIERFAHALGPIVDSGSAADRATELSQSVDLADVCGHELSPSAIAERWLENNSVPASAGRFRRARDHSLRAVVGMAADGPVNIDLRTQGPHALVGGTTGSGKSEFLQSWIVSLALAHSPARVTFLLIDYKGGAAFAECSALPHCVGLVTDLGPRLVVRALASLDAEVRYRERLLRDKRAKDILELESRNDPQCPPALVIVIDEFAALVADVPEFVDGIVNIAQRGRSLGLHLILATQRPAGVIKDNIRANTNVRVSLRMADEADSNDVLGSPEAAMFDPKIPGRAMVRSGPGRPTIFQSAYVGGWSVGRPRPVQIGVRDLVFGSGAQWADECPSGDERSGPVDVQRIVSNVEVAVGQLGLPPPRRPWLPELANSYRLESLPTDRTDNRLVFGVADDPAMQRHDEVAFHPDDGNLAVYGASGSGKTALLRSLAISAAFGSARGAPTWIYCIDFASLGLQMLLPLPHVGGVIPGGDRERLARLLRLLRRLIDERTVSYAAAGASTIGEYRERSNSPSEPRILLLVDGVGTFRSEYEGGIENRWWELFLSIAAEGRGAGVHVIVAADRPAAISSALAATIQRTLVLRLANELDYGLVTARTDPIPPSAPPGRGYLDGREVQVAVIDGDPRIAAQAAATARLAASMGDVGSARPPTIKKLPDRVTLGELPNGDDRLATIGVSDETLEPIGIDIGMTTFLVAGPPRSGTTTAVATILRSILRVDPNSEFVLFGRPRSPLADVVDWLASATDLCDIESLARRVGERVRESRSRVVVVIEEIGEHLNTDADPALQHMIRCCMEAGTLVIANGETGSLMGSWPLLQAMKINRSGVVLQPDQMDGDAIFKTPFPRTTRSEYPPGRGLLVQDARVRKVQMALPE